MKKTIALSLLSFGLLTGVVRAQKGAIPAATKEKVAKMYPQAINLKWDREEDGYEASFKNQGQEMSVVLDAKGTIKETETTIKTAELPTSARDYIAQKMPGKKIKEAAIIVDAAGRKIYEAEVNGKDYLFDASGKLVNQ